MFKNVRAVGEVRHFIKGQKEDKGKRPQSGVDFINMGGGGSLRDYWKLNRREPTEKKKKYKKKGISCIARCPKRVKK